MENEAFAEECAVLFLSGSAVVSFCYSGPSGGQSSRSTKKPPTGGSLGVPDLADLLHADVAESALRLTAMGHHLRATACASANGYREPLAQQAITHIGEGQNRDFCCFFGVFAAAGGVYIANCVWGCITLRTVHVVYRCGVGVKNGK